MLLVSKPPLTTGDVSVVIQVAWVVNEGPL